MSILEKGHKNKKKAQFVTFHVRELIREDNRYKYQVCCQCLLRLER